MEVEMAVKNTTRKALIKIITNPNIYPFLLTGVVLGIMFVFVRMKGVEQNYKFNILNKKMDKVTAENKELKAKKAKMTSVTNLRELAQKFDLKEPSAKQILVIP